MKHENGSGKQGGDVKEEGDVNLKKEDGNIKTEDKPSDGVVVVKAEGSSERSPGLHEDDEEESDEEFEEHPEQARPASPLCIFSAAITKINTNEQVGSCQTFAVCGQMSQ